MNIPYKFKPQNYDKLLRHKQADPVFLTRDEACLQYVRNTGGICLFCNENIEAKKFNLSLCRRREAWVLYSDDSYQTTSIELGRTLQQVGAVKVLIVPFPILNTSARSIVI